MKLICLLILSLILFPAVSANAQDSVTVVASYTYENLPLINRILIGKNYREIWSLPVKMKVFDIGLEKGGLRITELGGGFQTKSLRLKDKDSIEWSLRTVDKDVEKAVPEKLRKTVARKLIQDMISAAHPYAPLTIAPMAQALGVVAPEPELFFIPDDPRFGEYRHIFSNTVCMLERSEPTPDNSSAKNTEKLFEALKSKSSNVFDDTTFFKARLLDMLIADWDRHADQWKWGKKSLHGDDLYYPIPRDRDQAYFLATGMLVKVVRLFTLQHFVGFTDNDKRLINLNKKAWEFDRALLSQLQKEDWIRLIASFQQTLNNQTIDAALKHFPPEVYNSNGQVIFHKLVKRRDGLTKHGMRYYNFLTRHVLVNGTDDKETCNISMDGDQLVIKLFESDSKKLRYERKFDSRETKKIDIDLAGGDDNFVVEQDVNSKIKINLKGGNGKDSYNMKSKLNLETDEETKKEIGEKQ